MSRKGSIIYLFSINALIYIASVFYTPFLSAYYAQKGIPAEQIGILLMTGPCVILVVQQFWAKLSDRTGKRKEVFLLVTAGSGISMFLYYLGEDFVSMLLASLVVTSFTMAVIPLSDGIIVSLSLKKGYPYAVIRLGGTLGYAFMAVLAGICLKSRPQMQFIFSFSAYMLLFFVSLWLKDEGGTLLERRKDYSEGKKKIFTSSQAYLVLLLAFISQMGLSFYTGFIGPFILEKGYTQSAIGVMNCISALSEVPVLFCIDRMIKRWGTVRVLFLSCFLTGVRILLPAGQGILTVAAAQALQGFTYMTVYYSCALYISSHVYEESQSRGQSILGIVQLGLGAIAGNLAGGRIIDLMGYGKGYMLMAGIIVMVTAAALLGYLCIGKEKGGKKSEI